MRKLPPGFRQNAVASTAEVPVPIRSPALKPARVVVGAATIGGRPRQRGRRPTAAARAASPARIRRVLPIALCPGKGRLTQPIAGAQPRRRERVLMPHTCRSRNPSGSAQLVKGFGPSHVPWRIGGCAGSGHLVDGVRVWSVRPTLQPANRIAASLIRAHAKLAACGGQTSARAECHPAFQWL